MRDAAEVMSATLIARICERALLRVCSVIRTCRSLRFLCDSRDTRDPRLALRDTVTGYRVGLNLKKKAQETHDKEALERERMTRFSREYALSIISMPRHVLVYYDIIM